jgi:hypothetical protein
MWDAYAVLHTASEKKKRMTCGVSGEQCLPIFLPLGAVLHLNGHGQNMCPWADPNRQI